MKASLLLAENIRRLLKERHLTQHDLAEWCRHTDAWLSSFLAGNRGVPLKELDRIADFFAKATYELFIPGGTLERRSGHDRRSNRERRVGHAQRLMVGLADQIAPYRSSGGKAKPHGVTTSPFAQELRQLSARYAQELSALISRAESWGQATRARAPQSKARKGRGGAGGSSAGPASKEGL